MVAEVKDVGRRRRRLLEVLVVAVLASGVVTAAVVFEGRGEATSPSSVGAAAAASTSSTTTSTVAPATTTTTLALPQPGPSPADAHADVPVTAVGRISIPKIGLDTTLYEGVWLTVLDVGPGHWPGTAGPGGYGNMVVAAHRVTHSHPFRDIDRLVEGDQIVVSDATGSYTYRVTGTEIVTPSDLWIVDQHPGHTITLFACHPPGSQAYRYVVRGELVA